MTDSFGTQTTNRRGPDMSGLFTPPLYLTGPNGEEYVVRAPSMRDGLLLTAFNVGVTESLNPDTLQVESGKCDKCGQAVLNMDNPRVAEAYRQMNEEERPVEQIALGETVYQQMIDDGLSGSDIQLLGTYAMFYWSFGQAAADQWVELMKGGDGAAPIL